MRQTDQPDEYPQDIYEDDVCYRKVDPLYYAWLRNRMETAKRRFEGGRLPKAKWDALRGRFNRLQAWSIGYYGEAALRTAIREFNPANYTPPANRQSPPYLYPPTGDWRFIQPVVPSAVRKVDAIRDEAMAKGWSETRLYQNQGRFRFPLGQDYGLVCFVDPDVELGAVTEHYIEVVHNCRGDRHALRFYNMDVFPPRARKDGTAS